MHRMHSIFRPDMLCILLVSAGNAPRKGMERLGRLAGPTPSRIGKREGQMPFGGLNFAQIRTNCNTLGKIMRVLLIYI